MTKTFLAKAGLSAFGLYVGLVSSGFNTAYAATAKPTDTIKAVDTELLTNPTLNEASLMDPTSVVDATAGTLISGRVLRGAARGAAIGAIGGAIFGGKVGSFKVSI